MNNRWEIFKNAYSSNTNITKFVTLNNKSNILSDWQRELANERMKINGMALRTFAERYNSFKSENDLDRFFKEVLLKNFNGDREKGCKHLKNLLHQSGIMTPVSAALEEAIFEKSNKSLMAPTEGICSQINIEATSNGFKIQEIIAIKTLYNSIGKTTLVVPLDNLDNFIQAQGIVDVDLCSNTEEPTLSVESNQMYVHHSELKKIIDDRSLGQIIMDFLKKIIGLNKVIDISFKGKGAVVDEHKSEPSVYMSK